MQLPTLPLVILPEPREFTNVQSWSCTGRKEVYSIHGLWTPFFYGGVEVTYGTVLPASAGTFSDCISNCFVLDLPSEKDG